jgi:hypothetical protein
MRTDEYLSFNMVRFSPLFAACWLGNRWRQNEGDYRDDITAIVVVLPVFTPSTA